MDTTGNFEVIDVPPDGNCGYHAFINSMKMNGYSLKQGQKERSTTDELRKFLSNALSRNKPVNDEIALRELNKAITRIQGGIGKRYVWPEYWMSDRELDLLARKFKVCIHVFQFAEHTGWDGWVTSGTDGEGMDECLRKKKNIYLLHADGGSHFKILKQMW